MERIYGRTSFDLLVEKIPDFKPFWSRQVELYGIESGFSILVPSLVKYTLKLIRWKNLEGLKQVFKWVEFLLTYGGPSVQHALCREFLEELMDHGFNPAYFSSYFQHLGRNSKMYCLAWDNYRGRRNTSLWEGIKSSPPAPYLNTPVRTLRAIIHYVDPSREESLVLNAYEKKTMYPISDKRRLYQLIEMFVKDDVDEEVFSEEICSCYELHLDMGSLSKEEQIAFDGLLCDVKTFLRGLRVDLCSKILETRALLYPSFQALWDDEQLELIYPEELLRFQRLFITFDQTQQGCWNRMILYIGHFLDGHNPRINELIDSLKSLIEDCAFSESALLEEAWEFWKPIWRHAEGNSKNQAPIAHEIRRMLRFLLIVKGEEYVGVFLTKPTIGKPSIICTTCWEQIWPIGNILNEVCHGIRLDIEQEIGFSYDEVYALLARLRAYKVPEYLEYTSLEIALSDEEITILKKALLAVTNDLDVCDFSIRVGVSLEELLTLPLFRETTNLKREDFWIEKPEE